MPDRVSVAPPLFVTTNVFTAPHAPTATLPNPILAAPVRQARARRVLDGDARRQSRVRQRGRGGRTIERQADCIRRRYPIVVQRGRREPGVGVVRRIRSAVRDPHPRIAIHRALDQVARLVRRVVGPRQRDPVGAEHRRRQARRRGKDDRHEVRLDRRVVRDRHRRACQSGVPERRRAADHAPVGEPIPRIRRRHDRVGPPWVTTVAPLGETAPFAPA